MPKEELIAQFKKLNIPCELFLSELIDNKSSLTLNLADRHETPKVTLKFHHPISYRNSDEGYRLKLLNETDIPDTSPFCLVKNSEYLKWFHEQSFSIYEDSNLKHYMVVTPNDFIDVISEEDPEITIL